MPSPSPKAKKGKKKNAKIVQDEASTSDVKPAADEGKEAENETVTEELTPPEPSAKAEKGKKNAKNAPETDKEQFHGFNDDEISESADMNRGENEDEDEDPVDLSAPFPADMNYCLGTSSLHIFTNYVTTNV